MDYFVKEIDSTTGKILRAQCGICGAPLSIVARSNDMGESETSMHCNSCNRTYVTYSQNQELRQKIKSSQEDLIKKTEEELRKSLNI